MRVIEHNHFSPNLASNGLPTPLFPPRFRSVLDRPPSTPAFFLISQLLGFHIALFHVSSTPPSECRSPARHLRRSAALHNSLTPPLPSATCRRATPPPTIRSDPI